MSDENTRGLETWRGTKCRTGNNSSDTMDNQAQTKGAVLHSTEGHILLSGLLLALCYLLALLAGYLIAPQDFHTLAGMTATNLTFGRAAGLSFGYALHQGNWTVITVNFMIEVIQVLLLYPLFIFSLRRLVVLKPIENFMTRIREAAERNRDLIRRYGVAGLLLFVFTPFWMTGPVVGSVIGYFLGLKPWVNICVVLSGTLLAILGWAFLLRSLHARVAEISSFGPLLLLLVIVLIAVVGLVFDARRRRSQ